MDIAGLGQLYPLTANTLSMDIADFGSAIFAHRTHFIMDVTGLGQIYPFTGNTVSVDIAGFGRLYLFTGKPAEILHDGYSWPRSAISAHRKCFFDG